MKSYLSKLTERPVNNLVLGRSMLTVSMFRDDHRTTLRTNSFNTFLFIFLLLFTAV